MIINDLYAFLTLLFYNLEEELNNNSEELNKVKFQSEEANTDEFLKKYLKEFILKKFTTASNLEKVLIISSGQQYDFDTEPLQAFSVEKVLLPEELSDKQKKIISKQKESVYTNPDLYLEISNNDRLYYESIELKSTKRNKIPGSSIQQISPYEWVIFVKRDSKKGTIDIVTGHYINSITEKIPFPDRSPRPQVGFHTLKKWNISNRQLVEKQLIVKCDFESNVEKEKLLQDWQDYLTDEWLDVIKATTAKKNEKWFNSALRKFAIKFLGYIDDLSEEEVRELKSKLNALLDKNTLN